MTERRFWYTFNWDETNGKYYSGWCFGANEQEATARARRDACRFSLPDPTVQTATVWLQEIPITE